MVVQKHKPPSRMRYKQNHPTVSFRITRELYDELKAFLINSNQSFGDFVRVALEKQEADYDQSFTDGYSTGENDWKIWYFCSICRKKIYIQPNSDSHKSLIEYMGAHGWGHADCHKSNVPVTG